VRVLHRGIVAMALVCSIVGCGEDRMAKPRQGAKGKEPPQRGFLIGMTMEQVKSQLKSKYEVKEAGSAYPLGPTPWEMDHDSYYLLEVPSDGVAFEFNLRKRLICMREILPPKPKGEGEKDDFALPDEEDTGKAGQEGGGKPPQPPPAK